MSQETVTPANHIDLDSSDTKKLFAEAFASESGKDVNRTIVVDQAPTEVPVPEVKTEEQPKAQEEVKEDSPKVDVKQPEAKNVEPAANAVDSNNYGALPDWAKDLPDSVKANLSHELQEKLYYQQKVKSENGRQAALQKLLFNTRRELADLRTKLPKPQSESDDADLAAAAKNDSAKTIAEWNALIEADPNLAKAIDLRTSQLVKAETNKLRAETQEQIQAKVGPLIQHTEDTYEEQQRKIVVDQIPNFNDVVSSPVYAYWLNRKAAPGIKTLAYNSVEADDAITVMQMYAQQAPQAYQEMVNAGLLPPEPQQQQQVRQANVQQNAPQQVAPAQVAHADKVAQDRAHKISAAPVVMNAPTPITPTSNSQISKVPGAQVDMDDPSVQALFADAYKKNQVPRVR